MKHTTISIFATILLANLLASCNDFFAVEPQDFISQEQLFSSEKNAKTALTAVYNSMGNQSLYGRTLINELDTYSNDLCWGASTTQTGLSGWLHTSADQSVTNIWRYLYEGIDRANVFLDNINSVPNMTVANRNSMIAQARFIRALFYFHLVQNWGAVPLKLTATLTPQDIHIPVSSAEIVFNTIHSELDSAIKYLPNRLEYPVLEQSCRPSKTTAMALQARTYLRQAGVPFNITPQVSYAQAAKYAGDVIATGTHSLNPSFKQVFINLITDKYDDVFNENLMEVEFNYNSIYTNVSGFPGIGAPLKYNGVDIIQAGSATRTTRKLFNLYEITYTKTVVGTVTNYYPVAKDERRDWTIQDYTLAGSVYGTTQTKYTQKIDASNPLSDATHVYYRDNLNEITTAPPGRWVGKWRRDYEVASTLTSYGSPCNFPLIRYSEVLLIFAEADVMAKNQVTPEALFAINLVKGRSKASVITATDPRSNNVNLFISELRDERARELFGEGHRRSDLIRWGILNETLANLPLDDATISNWGRSIQGTKFNLLPYPEREISKNNAMKGLQNPGW
ncbi:MAG: RagB/SusD family nutrient uptake outer membrane protein [Paludibacter sp.]